MMPSRNKKLVGHYGYWRWGVLLQMFTQGSRNFAVTMVTCTVLRQRFRGSSSLDVAVSSVSSTRLSERTGTVFVQRIRVQL
jgi:hypothetical protein